MSEKKIGARIVIDGEKEYREALKNINTAQKELRSEMKLCTTQFSDTQNSMEALNAKAEILTKQIDSQKQKIEIYSDAIEASNKKQEDAKKHLDDLTDQYGKAEKELETMRKSADVSNDALQEQEKVVSSLKAELSKASDSYNAAERSTSSWQASLNNAKADLHTMEANLQKTNQYLDEAKKSADGCATSINNLGKETETAGEDAKRFGDVLKANIASEVVVAGVQKLGELVKQAGAELIEAAVNAALFADEIATMSVQTGVSASTLQELTYAQELMDVSIETVTSSMAKNIKSMDNARKGSADYVEAYKKLGVQITSGNGQLKDSEKVYWEVVDALKQVTNETERDAIAMTLFGKKAQDLNTLIVLGSEGFQEYAKEAHEVGYVMSDEMMNALLETSDAMERMKNKTEAAKNQIGVELAPVLEDAYERIGDSVLELSDDVVSFAEDAIPVLVNGFEWLLDNSDTVITAMAGIGAAIAVNKAAGPTAEIIKVLSASWDTYSAKVEVATVKQWLLNAAHNASPVFWITTAIIALTGAVVAYNLVIDEETDKVSILNKEYKDLKGKIEETSEAHKTAISTIVDNKNKCDSLISSLQKLNSEQDKDVTTKKQIAGIVAELNNSINGLNLLYDEEADSLSMTNEQLQQYSENMSEQAEYEENVSRMNELLIEQAELEQNLADAKELAASYTNPEQDAANMMMAANAVTQYTEALEANKTELETLKQSCSNYAETVETQNEVIQSGIDVSVEYNEKQYLLKDTTQEVADKITELQTAYADAKTAALDSINSQVGLFEELVVQSDLSVQQMAGNLTTQTEAYNQYTQDLQTAAALMNAGASPEFNQIVSSLMSMGVDGAGYLHELVTAAETDSEAFNEVLSEFGAMEDAKETLAGAMADIQTDYTSQMDGLLGVQTTKNEEKIANEEDVALKTETIVTESNAKLVTNTEDTMTQMNTAIVESTPVIEESITAMADGMIQSANSALGRLEGQSPKFKEIGKGIMEDLADGITDGSSLVSDALQQTIQNAVDNVDISGLAEKIDKKLGEEFSE